MARPRRLLAPTALLTGGLVLAAACASGTSARDTVDVGDGRISASRLRAVASGLCRAAEEAATDPEAARLTFFSESHDGLHTIARALEDVDRKAAADLLVAKQAVEADFAAAPSAGVLRDDLTTLAAATRTGLGRLDVSVTACPRE